MKQCVPTVKWLATLLFISILMLCTWVAWDNWGRFLHASNTNASLTKTPIQSDAVARGEYLAHIGGCIACHTAKGGESLAGGRRIDTPFGAAFSSNLTPSKTHGIGTWTAADFQTALRWGQSPSGRLLLPVFPYNHTSVFTDDDGQAIFTWLQTLKPVERSQPEHRITWPLATQPVIAVWRSLFFTPSPFKPNDNESAAWNRGAYLVQSAGHCAACHGPRNALGSFPAVDDLSGGFLSPQMWVAPSLVDATQSTLINNSLDDIAKLLRTGRNSSAHASGPMAEFVQHSGQYLMAADALAIATYLKSKVKPAVNHPTSSTIPLASSSSNAQALYQTHCASCHGVNGEGQTGAYPALAGNPAVTLAPAENLIQMTLYGGFGPSTTGRPRPYGMPPYLFTLNNQQIADVLNHIRSQWGNQAPTVSPVQVDRMRAASY